MTCPIYLDYQSTAPTDPRVVEAMAQAFLRGYGNPHSSHHEHGKEAADAIEDARTHIAELIGATPGEIVFTSGATEANNLVFEGLAPWLATQRRTHVITCVTEHPCALESAKRLGRIGFEVTILPVHDDGTLSSGEVEAALRPETGLVSLMAANNEIGTLHPVGEISGICSDHGAIFHTDAAQAIGKVPLDIGANRIGLASLSSHKVYGPIGVGALYVSRACRAKCSPMIVGGGQERGLRSGTLPTQLCIGFGEACALALAEMAEEAARVAVLRDRLMHHLMDELDGVHVNGTLTHRLPGNLNVSFAGIDAEALLMKIRNDLSISSGSACSAHSVEPSHVIRALGVDTERAEGAVRIGIGRFTSTEDIDRAAQILTRAVCEMRPIYRSSTKEARREVAIQ